MLVFHSTLYPVMFASINTAYDDYLDPYIRTGNVTALPEKNIVNGNQSLAMVATPHPQIYF